MSIHDRNYYNESEPGSLWKGQRIRSLNTVVIVVNIALFLLEIFWRDFGSWMVAIGHFSTQKLMPPNLEFWRLVSFQFLHHDPLHVFMNMLGLYMFGRIVEEHLGPTRYLAFYLVCGVFGGVMYFLLNAIGQYVNFWGFLSHDPSRPLIGASAGVFGVMMACAYLEPNTMVTAFPVPVPMKMRTLVYTYLGISVLMLLAGTSNAGGEAAHIGGAIAGYFFIRRLHLLRDFFDVFSNSRKARVPVTRSDVETNDRELDRLLMKVKEQGLHSLSAKERATLKAATEERRSA